jgi:signal transduction histidine kinase
MTVLEQVPRRRDRAVLAAAVAAVLLTASLVVFAVLKGERDGSAALQRLQRSQVEQLARSMNARIAGVYRTFGSIVDAAPWSATPRNPAEKERIAALIADPKARTGDVLVDAQRRVVNGTLLSDPASIGTTLDRPGLDGVLRGKPGVLPVGPGLTTALPTVAVGFPVKNAAGTVVGALLVEVDVSTQSDFNAEVSQIHNGRTGQFSYIDQRGTVIASSDPSLLGKRLDDPLLSKGPGFHRGSGHVAVVEPVPLAGWQTVFTQSSSEFDGPLTGPLKSALILIVLLAALATVVGVVLLARRLRAAREEQRRLEEVSAVREEFISIVSHELRTPVAGLLGFLQTTLDHWDQMADGERRRSIGRSLSSARRLHALTRDVLDSGAMDNGGLTYSLLPTDLREEVSSAVAAAQDLLPDRIVQVSLPASPTWVSCDRERISQVLTNLLDNAIKSAPTSVVTVTLEERAGAAVVSVADDGPGMSESELARVFEKFVRGRTSTPAGTGLGLYICKQIVTAHGGGIEARSEAGRGATVSFRLPTIPAPVEPAEPARV